MQPESTAISLEGNRVGYSDARRDVQQVTRSPLLMTSVEMASIFHSGEDKDQRTAAGSASGVVLTVNPLQATLREGKATGDVRVRGISRHQDGAERPLAIYSANRPSALGLGKSKLKRVHAVPEKSRMGRGRGEGDEGRSNQDGSLVGERAQFNLVTASRDTHSGRDTNAIV